MSQDPTGRSRHRRIPGERNDPPGGVDDPSAAELLQRSCLRVTYNLRDMVGADGCAALLARAIARTERDHPALASLTRQDGREFYLDEVTAAIEMHGELAVTAAIDALMAALVDVLGRLIGEDMAIRIIDLGATPGERRQGEK